ncbi:MAG TPA: aromatic ring-hydroxylating dioxygenase subunit alpha [Candidatus Acidoferrales bacterium]|nr:aromatic ring-hydroxylating dioxygenase subunit alpha [Candidatus Acidoferrales bacterium]
MKLDIDMIRSEASGIHDQKRVVANRVYYDQAIYQAEIENIFSRCWQLVCHESEVAAPGQFLATRIADSPVVIVRGKDEKLRAFYNTCRHRGSRVVMEQCGEATSLRCPYHFWVYSLEGELIGVPGEEAYDGSGFRKEDFPLVELRCDTMFGLVFVNPDEHAMSLAEWLGDDIVETLRTPLGGAEFVVTKKRSHDLSVNWKVWAENARDGYHVPFVHEFFRKASPPGEYKLCANGHAIQRVGMDQNGMEPALWDAMMAERLPGMGPLDGYVMTLFPDGFLMVRSNFVSIDMQHRVDATHLRFEERLLGVKGETPDVTERRSMGQEAFLWGPLLREDFPIFAAQQEGVMSRGVANSIIARGRDTTTGLRGDDNRLRHFWQQWRSMMGTERNA